MSRRAHKTLPQLHSELNRVRQQITIKREVKARLEREIVTIQERTHDLGRDIHNFGQIEASCRLWIARKELGRDT